ncbi:TPR-like protein [Decorospora gaudefroyi]|uniref:TPR-like protein n=1 Tax=Decorospora gaudefroyi TaxID=184978 RepID=A0A6A5K6U7_9PLEO|nr:TPR-like protein [Decorospora gaudefroyi]
MNTNNGQYVQWPSGQPPSNRRFLPVAGSFGGPAPNLPRPFVHHGREQHPVPYPQIIPPHHAYEQPHFQPPHHHQQPARSPFIPLIPLSAVEDLEDLEEEEEEEPPVPIASTFQDPFNRAYATSGPAVYEGFIPAPGREDEDEYPDAAAGLYDRDLESSDSEYEEYQRMIREEEDRLRQIEEKDDSEVDADYSDDEAQQDEGDPDEMDLGVDFEDIEEPTRSKRGRGATRGAPKTQAFPSILGAASTRGRRGGKRGRPSTRARGGYNGSASTRGRKRGKPGRSKGPRGPRPAADPGQEWKNLHQQANKMFIAQEYEEALSYAQQAIQLNPEIFDAYNIASEIYAAMGREEDSLSVLLAGAPTKRDPGLWQFIIERITKLDPKEYPQFTDENKSAAILPCLNEIILLNNDYDARSHKLEIEAQLGRASRCVTLGVKMLKTRKEQGEDPDTSVLKIMAMMGTSSPKQTRLHLNKLIKSFNEAIEVFMEPNRDPFNNELDWELINIYLDLLDRAARYATGINRLRTLSRWKQGRRAETFWDAQADDREFDILDEPRRITVPRFVRGSRDAQYGSTLPLEIRVKLGLFRLRRSKDDFAEAMHHLEMMEPDDHGPNGLIWDYEDLFRIIGDALHATGHDQDALRFYEPLFDKRSKEFNLMSYIGLHTCFKNEGQNERAAEVIPILKKWPAENYDDLAILAKFFEDQGMWQEAGQRAETIYRDKYGHKLKNLGFEAYDELRVHYYNQRRKARGSYALRKSTVRRNRKRMQQATGQTGEDDSSNENGNKELPVLGALSAPTERPKQGLFRTKRTKPPKVQAFLAVPEDIVEPLPDVERARTTLEGTDVPYRAIENRLFRNKLQMLATQYPDELKAARAQHRETVSSFKRLDEIAEAAEDGDEEAVKEVLSVTRELIEEFSTFDIFYSSRKEDLTTYFRRVTGGDLWKESALMVLAVVANNVEDGATDTELREKPDTAPEDFWGIHFDKWCDAFGRYAILLAASGDEEQCFATLDIALQANVFHRSRTYNHRLQLCRLTCALAADNSPQASLAARWLLKEYPFGTALFRLYSAANRLCSLPDGFATSPAYKVLMRYIKTVDYALLTPTQRISYNFRDTKDSTGGFRNNINIEAVSRVQDHDPALFALYAHVLMCGGSYMAALNYYFRAFVLTPDDPVLNLCIGVAYLQHAMKRLSENRQFQIQQGLAFVYRYYDMRTRACSSEGDDHTPTAILTQEAEFNVGRIWHSLGLVTFALERYEACIALSERVKKEAQQGQGQDVLSSGFENFEQEAAFAMQSIYIVTGNFEAARMVTEGCLVIE